MASWSNGNKSSTSLSNGSKANSTFRTYYRHGKTVENAQFAEHSFEDVIDAQGRTFKEIVGFTNVDPADGFTNQPKN